MSYRPEKNPIEMHQVSGRIPSWLNGQLYVLGPSIFDVNYSIQINDDEKEGAVYSFSHYWDGLPILQCFTIDPSSQQISFHARATAKEFERKIENRHGLPSYYIPWTSQSNQSPFALMVSPMDKTAADKRYKKPATISCSAFLMGSGDDENLLLLPKCSPPAMQMVDRQTLSPSGVVNVSDFAGGPGTAQFVAPCAYMDGDSVLTVTTTYTWGLLGGYCTYTAASDSNILAKINTSFARGGMVFGFGVADDFLIIPVCPYYPYYSYGAFFGYASNITGNFAFDQSGETLFYVISKSLKQHIATYRMKQALFDAKVVNMYIEDGRIELLLSSYSDATVLSAMDVKTIRSGAHSCPANTVKRVSLSNINATLTQFKSTGRVVDQEATILSSLPFALDMTTIHPGLKSKKPKYAFGLGFNEDMISGQRRSKFWDVFKKIDLKSGEILAKWSQPGYFPASFSFIPVPDKPDYEDEGVLALTVYDGSSGDALKYQLLMLDARDLRTVAVFELPRAMEKRIVTVREGEQLIQTPVPIPAPAFTQALFLPSVSTQQS